MRPYITVFFVVLLTSIGHAEPTAPTCAALQAQKGKTSTIQLVDENSIDYYANTLAAHDGKPARIMIYDEIGRFLYSKNITGIEAQSEGAEAKFWIKVLRYGTSGAELVQALRTCIDQNGKAQLYRDTKIALSQQADYH